MIVVSGLPRSGTSMMMSILQSAGCEIATDGLRKPNEHNKKGYFEIDSIGNKLKENSFYLEQYRGKCIKVISYFLKRIGSVDFKVIFMRRDFEEIIKSMSKMLGREISDNDNQMQQHLYEIIGYLNKAEHCNVLYVDYVELIDNYDDAINNLSLFLPELNFEKSIDVINPSLYHNRSKVL